MSDIFKEYPTLECYYKTSDGQCFFNENSAQLHGRTLKDTKVAVVERGATKEKTSEAQVRETAQAIIAKVSTMDLDSLKDYLTKENADENPRSTVVKALEARIAELAVPDPVDTEGDLNQNKPEGDEA